MDLQKSRFTLLDHLHFLPKLKLTSPSPFPTSIIHNIIKEYLLKEERGITLIEPNKNKNQLRQFQSVELMFD